MKNVILAGDVDPKSRILSPSSRAIHLINSLKPVERRSTLSPLTAWSAEPCRPELPKILLNMLGAIAHHCTGSTAVSANSTSVVRPRPQIGHDWPLSLRWPKKLSRTARRRPAGKLSFVSTSSVEVANPAPEAWPSCWPPSQLVEAWLQFAEQALLSGCRSCP